MLPTNPGNLATTVQGDLLALDKKSSKIVIMKIVSDNIRCCIQRLLLIKQRNNKRKSKKIK